MARDKYLTAPLPSDKMPAGVPYILANETAERFAFYGMSSILVVFMTKHLMGPDGMLDVMANEPAKAWFHWFTAAVYFMAVVGAVISDIWLGKFKTIIWFSMLYCVGFAVLAWNHTLLGLVGGLTIIAVSSGIVKPCVSANVGDQFGAANKHLIEKVYGWFYFSINLGACVSMFLCPILLDKYGPAIGFGVPAVFMVIAVAAYWLGRHKLVHIPPAGQTGWRESLDKEGIKTLGRLCIIFLFVSVFFALFFQSESAWVLQAEKMNLRWVGFTWRPAQMQSANPFLIMILIPLFSYAVYPALNRLWKMTALRRIGIGMFVAVVSFVVCALIETNIRGGDVFKCSSRSTITGLEPVCLIDGVTDGSGWSSNRAPTSGAPEEIVIRLRERKAWTVEAIEIDPRTTLSRREIVATLDRLGLELLSRADERKDPNMTASDRSALRQKGNRFRAAAREAKRAAKKAGKDGAVQAAKAVGRAALAELGEATTLLDDKAYFPGDVSVFAGDFRDRLVPKPFSELIVKKKDKAGSPRQYTDQAGWTHLGDYSLADDVSSGISLDDFEPVTATHILVQINSNHGANRIKIGEIKVMTGRSVPAGTRADGGTARQNIAGIGYRPSLGWQFFAYIILTAAEVMVSITALEFAYTQAPKKMKSLIQSVNLLSISLGNTFAAIVNGVIKNPDGTSKLPGASYYWFFVIAMLVTAVVFIPVAARYKAREYIQDEAPAQG
jgi:POT family proton-dependent oligopeptide transporter